MNKTFLTLLFFMLAINVFSQNETSMTEFNFGFEKTTANAKLPDNWFQWGKDYHVSIDTIIKRNGTNAVRIYPSNNRDSNSFGCVAYEIPAVYEGEEIEVRAYMKMKDVKEGPIGLMLRIDGASGGLEFDNMQQKNIQGTSDWTKYSVKLPYPKNAKTIYIGAILSGTGQLWIDDVELSVDGKAVKPPQQKMYKADKDNEFDRGSKIDTVEITEEKIKDLTLLGKVWGFLKYYHPNIASGDYNWDYELFRVLPQILAAKNLRDRDNILSNWIKRLGTFEVTNVVTSTNGEVKIDPDLEWLTNSNLTPDLASQLANVKSAKRADEHYYIGLVEGVGNPEFKHEKPYSGMKYPDAGFRLLSLYRYWNIIQYYFPYKNLIEEDWKEVLKEFIPKVIHASNEIEYKLIVLELIARIHDTHANIWGQDTTLNKYRGLNYAPFELTFIENRAVVTGFHDQALAEKSGLQIGDVITMINNRSVEEIIIEKLKSTPASNYPTQLRDIARNLLRTNDATMNVEFIRNGNTESKELIVYSKDKINTYAKYQKQDTCFKLITPDIAYLYPGTIKNQYLPGIFKEIINTKGLIIDFRCYPSDFIVFSLSEYLLPVNTGFVKFSNGNIKNPGEFTMTNILKVGKNNTDYYKGKVIILINELTQSSAEYHTMAFRTAPIATVIGSTTAGADGNVSVFYLPGGIRTMISGIGVYYPDGRETQRIGIIPDIELKPTIEGIRLKRDELLEKAIEIIEGK